MEIQTSNFRKQIDIGDYRLPASPKWMKFYFNKFNVLG
jgi:hypothetical protein